MEIVKIILSVLVIILSIGITALVLMQSGKGKELSSTIAGGNSSYLGNTKTNDKDKLLFKVTAVLAVVFILCVMGLFFLA